MTAAPYEAFLKNVDLFATLPANDIRLISMVCREEQFPVEQVLFGEGSIGDRFYIVLDGSVEIWKDYDTAEQDLLTLCETGHAFGELALIDDFPRSATAVVREGSSLLWIRREDFQRVIRSSASIAFSLLQFLAGMVRDRTDSYIQNLRERNRHLEKAYARLKQEIEDRRLVEKKLHHQAFHDSLTGLPNRALFLNRLRKVMKNSSGERKSAYAILYLDLDRFSVINESLGHESGDELLKQVADRLRHCLRRSELVARFSGDEFAILLEGTNHPQDTLRVVRRIKNELDFPFDIEGKEIFVTAGIGIVPGDEKYETTVDLLRDADIAMYGAKALGLGEYQIYDESLHDRTLNLLHLETDLRRAVERGEFVLKYQPIIALDTCRVAGFEILVRWLHPDRGLISPEVFIPIAEKTGYIQNLGHWILEEACIRTREWLDHLPAEERFFVNVNISGRQFMQNDFMSQFRKVLRKSGLPGHFLKLEMTESVLIENVDHLIGLLKEIKSLGVHIALDDFGTGYSSLSYLHRFPIDTLKIDRSFTARMGQDPEKQDMVAVIISIAQSMKMDVVAEGVETLEQLELLRSYGCEYGQGFFFSKPLSESDAFSLITGGGESLLICPVPGPPDDL